MSGDAQGGVGRGNGNGEGEARGGRNGQTASGEFEPQYAPSRIDKEGNLVRVQGRDLNGRTSQTDTGPGQGRNNQAVRPYAEAYSDYSGAASNYLDEHYIPITLKDYVRDYFADIAPEDAEDGR